MEREFEAKGLVSEQLFYKLIRSLNVVEIKEQSNTYIDSDNFFKNQNCALRLRIIAGQHIFSLKRKDSDGATEWNQPITAEEYKSIIAKHQINLADYNCPYDQVLTNTENITIQTTRYVCEYQGTIVELDQTTFGNTVDFEIEIETESLETSQTIMNNLCDEFGIVIKKSYPKIARYFMYN
ncbi:CYTH domain-containing protein [Mollicutes bacterium LVI A0039]|nr:CYTH domain-containing protein [Mollicutes bacterium LVI A0039]